MRIIRFALGAAFAILALATPASAQTERYDLGQRLKRFETAWEEVADPAGRRRAMLVLPPITRQFFSLQFGEAGRTFDLAAHTLRTENEPSPDEQFVASLTATPKTRIIDGQSRKLTVTVRQFYTIKDAKPKPAELRFWFVDRQVTTAKPEKDPFTVEVPLPPLGESKGLDRKLYFMAEAGKAVRRSAVMVSVIDRASERVTALKKASAAWTVIDTIEKATIRDRAELLGELMTESPPETDFPAAGLLENAEVMLDGKPFFTADRPGQFWMSVPVKGQLAAPIRVSVPKGLSPKKPVPVVVLLHGAGGSENLFFEGYGAGNTVAECEKRGWLVVATRGGFLSPPPVAEIIDQLAKRYPINPKRVFLIGHSMGSAHAVDLIQRHPTRFAGAALLGGGGTVRQADAFTDLPVFIGVGDKDFALPMAKGLGDKLNKGGAKQVTFKEYPDVEHLLIVREAMADVLAGFDRITDSKLTK